MMGSQNKITSQHLERVAIVYGCGSISTTLKRNNCMQLALGAMPFGSPFLGSMAFAKA